MGLIFQFSAKCVDKYSAIVSKSLGSLDWQDYILTNMKRKNRRCEFRNDPILGVGPGSSGTRSLNLLLMMLNVSSQHFGTVSFNCKECHKSSSCNNKMLHSSDTKVALLDHPGRWL